jgi:hypothetical protein
MNVFLHPRRKKTSLSFVKIHKKDFPSTRDYKKKKIVDNFDPTALFVIG